MYNLRMNVSTIIELVGYTGSLLVIISMLMTSLTKLRVVNSIGCIVFATYALIIKSYPTAAMQACLLIINCIGLYNLSKNKKQYSITELQNGDSYINFFIESYKNDIEKFFPKVSGFSATSVSDTKYHKERASHQGSFDRAEYSPALRGTYHLGAGSERILRTG